MADEPVFVDVSKILVPHGVSPESWVKRYGLEPFHCPCQQCGSVLITNIPFACQSLRGLISPPCACGEKHRPYCVVRDPRVGDLLPDGFWGYE